MKSKTKKTTQKISKAFAVGSHDGQIFAHVPYTQEDFKNSLLIVSVMINVAFLILWILMQLNIAYTYQIALALVGN